MVIVEMVKEITRLNALITQVHKIIYTFSLMYCINLDVIRRFFNHREELLKHLM